jgi:hypothetical protein
VVSSGIEWEIVSSSGECCAASCKQIIGVLVVGRVIRC